MASLNRRPHGVEDSLRAVQFALLKSGFQQLNFGITSLCDHGKLQSDWFVWDNLTHEVCVQQQLVGLFVGLSRVPERSRSLEVSYDNRVVCFQ